MKYSRLVPLLEQENLKLKNDIELLNRHIQQQDAEIKRLEAKSASQTEIYEKLEFHSAESEFSLRKRKVQRGWMRALRVAKRTLRVLRLAFQSIL